MKHALIVNNKILDIANTEQQVFGGWQEVPDTAKIGDVYNPQVASREDNLLTEMPSVQELIVTLWESVISGDTTARDALEQRRQAIKAKYPRL